jgi:shikimate dehydrogenase
MSVAAKAKLCVVIGDPVEHSLSPIMHNAGYAALDLSDDFVYEARLVQPEALSGFVDSIRTTPIRGVSCTAPHKIAVMQYLDVIDPVARRIGAVNTIVNEAGNLSGYNTDWLGILVPLEHAVSLTGKKVALIGAGGAARAAAYGLTERQAKLTVYNRTLSKAQELAREFGGQAAPLEDLASVGDMDIIIATVSQELTADQGTAAALGELVRAGQVVFDIAYGLGTSSLLREAAQRGAQVINGLEMLLQQGTAQFKLFTGHDAPETAMRTALQAASQSKGGTL